MKRVVWAAAAVSAALLAGCSSPHIALAQPNAVTVPVGGTYGFNGLVQDSNGTILWKLDGPGFPHQHLGGDDDLHRAVHL